MEIEGNNCIFNKEANKVFSLDLIDDIRELFPDIHLDKDMESQNCIKKNTKISYPINLTLFKDTNHWLIEIKDSLECQWDEFVKCQRLLHVLFLDLISINSEKDLYKTLIIKARKILNIDRIGILLFDSQNGKIKGTWGTNRWGEVVDQSSYEGYLAEKDSYKESLDFKNYAVYNHDTYLYDDGEIIGRGWNTKSIFYAGQKPVGWISCDNSISKKPLPIWKKEILGELARMTGEFLFNLRLENHLKSEVEKKTVKLNKTIQELKETQDNLIEAEKLASIGSLISGVAHEINTPIGVALTGVSHIEETTKDLMEKIDGGRLKKKDLDIFVNDSLYSSTLCVSSLKRAGELVNIFKQLSVDQESTNNEELNLSELVENVLLSIKYSTKLNGIKVETDIDKNINFIGNPKSFYQILTNLINNSIIHGFINIPKPLIKISGRIISGKIDVNYSDNGVGIPKKLHKKVFEPFYTTKRNQGNTGLGLNIIYNSVLKQGGKISIKDHKDKGTQFNIQFNI